MLARIAIAPGHLEHSSHHLSDGNEDGDVVAMLVHNLDRGLF